MMVMKILILAKCLLSAYKVPGTILSAILNKVNINLFNYHNNPKV